MKIIPIEVSKKIRRVRFQHFGFCKQTNAFREFGKHVDMWLETSKQREPFRNIYVQQIQHQEPFRNIEGDEGEQKWQATKENRRVPNPRAAHRNTTYTYSVIIHYLLK